MLSGKGETKMGLTILEALAVVTAGMMTGNELCVSIFHEQLRQMEDRAQFDLGQKSAAVFGKVMPFWYAATLLLSGAVAYSLRGAGREARLADLAAALFLVSIVYTVTLLVPINTRIASWHWDTRPSDWVQARQTWDTRHLLRVFLLAVALVCLVLACLMQRGQ
jgi:hypothetical protein